jgi:hypothetical protein
MPPVTAKQVVVPVNDFSDGSETRWPGAPYTVSDQELYMIKLATLWMEERGEAVKGA